MPEIDKRLFMVVIVALLLPSIGYLILNKDNNSYNIDEFNNLDVSLPFDYDIGDCLDYDPVLCGIYPDNSFDVFVVDGVLYFDQLAVLNCAATRSNLKIEIEQSGSDIIIRETLHVCRIINENETECILADCICAIEIKGSITDLEEGIYTLTVIYQYNLSDVENILHTLIITI